MAVTLIGYRGTGKSAVAPLLAARWGWDWLDADVELERRAGRTIRDIFATDGEPEFRRLERELLAELLERPRWVIAAGGGAILAEATRTRMRASGPVVWLQAEIETIAARIAGDASTAARRPNLTAQGGVAEIAAVLAARQPLYAATATLGVATDHDAPEQIATTIDEQLRAAGWSPERGAA